MQQLYTRIVLRLLDMAASRWRCVRVPPTPARGPIGRWAPAGGSATGTALASYHRGSFASGGFSIDRNSRSRDN